MCYGRARARVYTRAAMRSGDDDRARILLRRTAFLSSALAAIGGCTPERPPESPGESNVVAVQPGGSEDEPTEPVPEDAPAEPKAEMPSLEMPENIGPTARERFQRLFGMAEKQNGLIDELEKLVPDGCGVLAASCEGRWRSFAAKYNELKMSQTFMHGCPGSSGDAKLYAEREREHFDHLREREKRLFDRVQQLLDQDGKAGEERWAKLQEEAYTAAPYPCLSIACEDW